MRPPELPPDRDNADWPDVPSAVVLSAIMPAALEDRHLVPFHVHFGCEDNRTSVAVSLSHVVITTRELRW